MISEKEKQEWLALAKSESLKKDMRRLVESRQNPILKDEALRNSLAQSIDKKTRNSFGKKRIVVAVGSRPSCFYLR